MGTVPFSLKAMLDEEFVSIFAPMHLISTCLFIRKYDLYKSRLTPSSNRGIILSVFGIIIVFTSLILTLYSLSIINIPTYYTYLFIYIQYAVGCSMIIVFNLRNSFINTKLLIILQMIEHNIPDRRIIKRIKIIVWFSCFTMILSHGTFITLTLFLDPFWTNQKGCFVILTFILDFELFYSTIVAYFMACKMKQWTQVLNKNNKQSSDSSRVTEHTLQMMYKTFKSLLDALTLVKKTTQWTVTIELFNLHIFIILRIQSSESL